MLIDITPEGAKTPEGRERIERAVTRLHDANARCADALSTLLSQHVNRDDEDWVDAQNVLDARSAACEELVRAVAGRKPR
jgi:hypothetical protein